MKHHKIIALIFAMTILFIVFHTPLASATPSIETLVPNLYEDKEFRDNKEFLRKESTTNQTKQVPEEQKSLQFELRDYDPNEKVKEELFSSERENRKTIALQAEQLDLFAKEPNQASSFQENQAVDEGKGNAKLQSLYLGILAIAVVIILVLLIPRMAQGSK
ncbi:type VII secretion protein EssA [Cytobacillus purgationiresistens]|uniref:Type VII secretion protein EssA n=1 Tax=Cytobacillus purgationiresistens TaxID=863449 RepID=A0ABU0AQ12_9BACI|nr:type VII secretion protein EssA [Cytobacillus purgationiresistens]MDQ0273310.1 type VII secretion protein EssA [Cytobacillus purgationiresistens]